MSVSSKVSPIPCQSSLRAGPVLPVARRVEKSPTARQRGAIGLFGILTLLLALLFTALALDAGRLWFVRRHLQAVADLAALEAAHELAKSGCNGSSAGNYVDAAQAAAERNGFPGDLRTPPNRVELGGLRTVAGRRQFMAGNGAYAVHVVATRSVPASLLLGGLFGHNTLIRAEATARPEPPQASFSAGSYLLRVSATSADANLLNLLLGGLLGSSLSLDVASYRGLASTDVNLLQLVRAHGAVGTVEELLNADLSVADIVRLTANAVDQGSVAYVALNQLPLINVENVRLRLLDVLNVSMPDTDAAGKVGVNVLDLITATLMVVNKNHAIALPLSVNLGSPLNVNAQVHIIEPPQIAIGPAGQGASGQWCTQARTAQIRVMATVNSNLLNLVSLDLGLLATVAQGEPHLETLDVASSDERASAVIDATPGVAALGLTNSAGSGSATLNALGYPIRIDLDLPVQTAGGEDLTFDVEKPVTNHLPLRQSVSAPIGGSLAAALANPNLLHLSFPPLDPVTRQLIEGLVTPLLSSVLSPLLGFIGSALLDPLLKLLGLQLGGLDVTLTDIRYPGGAQLVI